MIKWFAYIVLILIFAPVLLFAGVKNSRFYPVYNKNKIELQDNKILKDTLLSKNTKQREQDEKNKIKGVAKAKKQAKPEKVDDSGVPVVPKPKPKRQRRPEGLERPPEIPRRNSN
ncbi:hypothetical protein [Mucilaginibacter lappiensis]|jgi:hypothetical protein|uniref:hypothetical protein n=1 Tax=Mucilaginibacter lappiensis TaxID=354630 RepID=UPI003D22713F